jgi:hypothetical protein
METSNGGGGQFGPRCNEYLADEKGRASFALGAKAFEFLAALAESQNLMARGDCAGRKSYACERQVALRLTAPPASRQHESLDSRIPGDFRNAKACRGHSVPLRQIIARLDVGQLGNLV